MDEFDTISRALSVLSNRIRDLEALNKAPLAYNNLLVNGGFESWRLGNGPFTSDNDETADAWYIDLDGASTISVTRISSNPDRNSRYSMQVVYTHSVGADPGSISQIFSSQFQYLLRSMSLSLSVRVVASVANAVRLRLGDYTSDWHPGDGQYSTLVVTNPQVPDDILEAPIPTIEFASSGTYVIDNAMCVVGTFPLEYSPNTDSEPLITAIETATTVTQLRDAIAAYLRARAS